MLPFKPRSSISEPQGHSFISCLQTNFILLFHNWSNIYLFVHFLFLFHFFSTLCHLPSIPPPVPSSFPMGDHSSSTRVPGLINPLIPTVPFSQPFSSKLDHGKAPAGSKYYSTLPLPPPPHPSGTENAGPPPPIPTLTPTHPLIQNASKQSTPESGRSWDTGRIIQLQKQAIESVVECPTLYKYVTSAFSSITRVGFRKETSYYCD